MRWEAEKSWINYMKWMWLKSVTRRGRRDTKLIVCVHTSVHIVSHCSVYLHVGAFLCFQGGKHVIEKDAVSNVDFILLWWFKARQYWFCRSDLKEVIMCCNFELLKLFSFIYWIFMNYAWEIGSTEQFLICGS